MPRVGLQSFNLPGISKADYIELVDFTGRELHPGKRGKILTSAPKALTKLGLDKNYWTTRVKGIVSGYGVSLGVEELSYKAKKISQRTLFGIGFARILKRFKAKLGNYFCRVYGWVRWVWTCFGLGSWAKLIEENGNASGFWGAGIFGSKAWLSPAFATFWAIGRVGF